MTTYLLSFLEGIITFISPCMLPMLPIYLSYFSGANTQDPDHQPSTKGTMLNVLSFILGFSVVLISLGALAGVIGNVLLRKVRNSSIIHVVSGIIIIIIGLSYMGLFKLPIFQRTGGPSMDPKKLNKLNVLSSFVFGVVFSIAWSPCYSAFLAVALGFAANTGTVLQGSLMLFAFAMGLGIPFLVSALLLNQLTGVFQFIKKHYKVVNLISGGFLVLTGIAMMTGLFNRLLGFLTPL